MTKYEFLEELRGGLSGLPQNDIDERADFYSEMIDDLVEDGVSESEAVAKIGPVGSVVQQILSETPLSRIVRERVRPRRRFGAWEVALLVLGSPLWISALLLALAVVLTVYVILWAFIVSLWAAEASLVAGAVAGTAAGVFYITQTTYIQGAALIGAGLALAGLAIFAFFLCFFASKGAALLSAKIALLIKSMFVRRRTGQ